MGENNTITAKREHACKRESGVCVVGGGGGVGGVGGVGGGGGLSVVGVWVFGKVVCLQENVVLSRLL